MFLLISSMTNKGISKWNVAFCKFREGRLPKISIESTSFQQKENSCSHGYPQVPSFPSLYFSKNYQPAVLGSRKIYSRGIRGSFPRGRNQLWCLRSSSSTLVRQKIFQCFSQSELCFNTVLHSLITEGNLQSPFNSRSLTVCELNNGKSSYICSARSRPVPKPLYHTIMTAILHYSRVWFFILLMFHEN